MKAPQHPGGDDGLRGQRSLPLPGRSRCPSAWFGPFFLTAAVLGCSAAENPSSSPLNLAHGGTAGNPVVGLTSGAANATGAQIELGTAGTPTTQPVPSQTFNGKLTGYIRDFHASFPDMEMHGMFNNKAYYFEPGIVQPTLGADHKPIYAGDPLLGTAMTTGKANFDQWYRDVPEVNLGRELTLQFTDPEGDGIWTYDSNHALFPIDNELFGNEGNPHNFHFTLELHTLFTYRGGEVFTFEGDDDVWIFINNQLVVDIGGCPRPDPQVGQRG